MTTTKHRSAVCVTLVCALTAGLLTGVPELQAQAQTGTDYHLDAFGDPMDFSNAEDHVIANEAQLFGTSNAAISDGLLRFDANGPAFFSPLWGGYPTGIPHGREGGLRPLDTSRYQRLVLRMNAPGGITMMARWYTCLQADDSCSGGHQFTTADGWNTYDLTMTPNTPDPVNARPWAGQVLTVRLTMTTPGPTRIEVDWVRFVPAGLQPVEQLTGGAPPPPFPVDRLDYATLAGNAWDWDTLADATPVNLRSPRVENGRIQACNTPVSSGSGDPGLVLRLPGGRPIDADRFRTLTVEYSYDGPFSTRNGPGGGMVARVFWNDSRGRHPTKGIHLYPNERWFQIRLDDPRTIFEGIEPGKGVATGAPWAGQVTALRIDPNQDAGGRCWSIGRIWLTSDEPNDPAITLAPVPATAAPRTTARATRTPTTKRKSTTKRRTATTVKRR